MLEFLLAIVIGAVILAIPVAISVMAIVALVRTRRIVVLERRIEQLEAKLAHQGVDSTPTGDDTVLPAEAKVPTREPGLAAEQGSEPPFVELPQEAGPSAPRNPIQWELLIGQKAFGWIAVALAVFATSFFLKYAYENNWIGPIGRVTIGLVCGLVLMLTGLRYHHRGWSAFSQMLSACGTIVLYMSTYSAFGFYELLPSFHAGAFLTIIVILSALCAVCYNSPTLALVAILGGLLCPLLLHTEHDSYVALFCYLTALNVGVATISLARAWPGIGSCSLIGTQSLFWVWYQGNYHPEKLSWALGFQLAIYLLYLGLDLAIQLKGRKGNRHEAAGRMLVNAAFWFGAFFVLMQYDYRDWMGVAAVAMATLYLVIARIALFLRRDCSMELVATISIAVGFLVLAIPLQADASWVAVSWAAAAVTLWWFGLRVEMPALRFLSSVIATGAAGRTLFIDLWSYPDEWICPLLNVVAAPSIGVAICILAAVLLSRRYLERLGPIQKRLISLAGLCALILLWLVLTFDVYHSFDMFIRYGNGEPTQMRWLGQMSVSILWTLFASALLVIGFRSDQKSLRWMAIGFFTVTIFKVFLVDMSQLHEVYRIVAFFILAVFLAIAARVYQRVRPGRNPEQHEEGEPRATS